MFSDKEASFLVSAMQRGVLKNYTLYWFLGQASWVYFWGPHQALGSQITDHSPFNDRDCFERFCVVHLLHVFLLKNNGPSTFPAVD